MFFCFGILIGSYLGGALDEPLTRLAGGYTDNRGIICPKGGMLDLADALTGLGAGAEVMAGAELPGCAKMPPYVRKALILGIWAM